MSRAGYSNPCTEAGEPLPCECCTLPARHRRELPEKQWRPTEGLVYLMGVRDKPIMPQPLSSHEVRCQFHITDWQGGPVPFPKPFPRPPTSATTESFVPSSHRNQTSVPRPQNEAAAQAGFAWFGVTAGKTEGHHVPKSIPST